MNTTESKKRILILGGFGGVATARRLQRPQMNPQRPDPVVGSVSLGRLAGSCIGAAVPGSDHLG